jgi:tripartite-type tricarboxylate transporter receptor subunit TctC
LALPQLVFAQPYPSRPITVIVPFGAGGPADSVARILGDAMRTSLGQPVVIENVTGASGTIGVARAVRAPADGYTLSLGNWPSHIVNGAIYALPYDVRTDFEPAARLSSNPYVIVARKNLPAADLKQLVAWLKANPDKATQGTAGPGSGQHVSGIYFQEVTATRFQFVPSRRLLRDHARPRGGTYRSHVRPGHHCAAPRAQRLGEGLCRDLDGAAGGSAGHPHG